MGSASTGRDDGGLDLRIAWLMLPESRPGRELFWLSQMPGASVTAVGETPTGDPVPFVRRPYRRPTRRFVEAGALAWLRDSASISGSFGWVASLELCSLVTGQATSIARRIQARQAVFTWGNDHRNPLYLLPPYRQALHRAKSADLFVCVIEAAREHCIALGIPAERCVVVHPPIDTELFHPPVQPVEHPIAVFVSPLASNKGIDRVLDAFALVRRHLPEAELRVVGGGPLEPLVAARSSDPRTGVTLVGARDRRGVAEELRGAAVFVTAPRPTRVWNEQFGLAYVEAMACGLPVVTTICGTNYEATRAPNARVVDDVEALAEALEHFLVDAALRREIGRANRAEVLERYEFHQQIDRLREAFLSAQAASDLRAPA